MKWTEDLTYDIRTLTAFDDFDGNDGRIIKPQEWRWPDSEVTDNNQIALKERFLRIKNECTAILEIGVSRISNKEKTTTSVFLSEKLDKTFYVGIDIDDKSFLNNADKNIHTIKNNSLDIENNLKKIYDLGITEFGFIFIDGYHSINHVLTEWEYTKLLSKNGIVGFHDTTQHPGPYYFVRALDKTKWVVEENVCTTDHGIGFAWRK